MNIGSLRFKNLYRSVVIAVMAAVFVPFCIFLTA